MLHCRCTCVPTRVCADAHAWWMWATTRFKLTMMVFVSCSWCIHMSHMIWPLVVLIISWSWAWSMIDSTISSYTSSLRILRLKWKIYYKQGLLCAVHSSYGARSRLMMLYWKHNHYTHLPPFFMDVSYIKHNMLHRYNKEMGIPFYDSYKSTWPFVVWRVWLAEL